MDKLTKRAGAFSIALGAVILVIGIAVGVLSILNGGALLSGKK